MTGIEGPTAARARLLAAPPYPTPVLRGPIAILAVARRPSRLHPAALQPAIADRPPFALSGAISMARAHPHPTGQVPGGGKRAPASAKTTLRPRDGLRPPPPPSPRAQPPKGASAPRFWPPLRASTPPAGPPPPKTLVFSAFECPLQLRDFASPLPQRQVRQPDRILLAKPRAWRGPRCHGRLPEVGVLLLYGCGPWLPPAAFGAGSGRAPRAAAEGSCLATTPAAAGVRSPGRRGRRSGAPALVSGDGHSPAAP